MIGGYSQDQKRESGVGRGSSGKKRHAGALRNFGFRGKQ